MLLHGSGQLHKVRIIFCACRQAGALGGGSAAAALAKQREQEAEADLARKRFGNAKSISSAQFNSNEDSNAVDYEKQVGHVSTSICRGTMSSATTEASASLEGVLLGQQLLAAM